MLHSDFITEIVGHIDGDIRKIEMRDGVGCSFRIQTRRTFTDDWGVPHDRPMWVPVITFDTATTARIMRDFQRGSFVQVFCREVRFSEPRQAKNGKYYNNVDFVIDAIEDARLHDSTELTAEESVLQGVTA